MKKPGDGRIMLDAVAAMMRDYAAGASLNDLAESYRCSPRTARRRLEEAGVTIRGIGEAVRMSLKSRPYAVRAPRQYKVDKS